MAITVEPQFDSRQLVTDGKTLTSKIYFIVKSDTSPFSPEQALFAPGVPNTRNGAIPAEAYPYDPRLKCDSKGVAERINDTTYRVVCNYSNQGIYSFPKKTETVDLETRSFAFTVSYEAIDFPIFVKSKVFPTNSPTPIDTWETQSMKINLAATELNVVVNVDNFDYDSVSKIQKQIGKWHKFQDNSYWRFLGSTSNSIDVDTYRVTYTWARREEFDSRPLTLPPEIACFRGTLNQYEALIVVPQGLNAQPIVQKITTGDLDAFKNGWETLPGKPIQ